MFVSKLFGLAGSASDAKAIEALKNAVPSYDLSRNLVSPRLGHFSNTINETKAVDAGGNLLRGYREILKTTLVIGNVFIRPEIIF